MGVPIPDMGEGFLGKKERDQLYLNVRKLSPLDNQGNKRSLPTITRSFFMCQDEFLLSSAFSLYSHINPLHHQRV
jgi:hypothetical protein